MARTIDNILSTLEASLITLAASVGLTVVPSNWSETDYKLLFLNIIATAMAIQEQLFDAHQSAIEAVALVLPPQTFPWFQNQMLNVFEYDASAVPIVQLDTTTSFVPIYPSPNPNFNIIKFCTVKGAGNGIVNIKIAGAGPSQISSTPLAAAQSFAYQIGTPGIVYNVISSNSDKLFMQLDVYYNGLYSNVIQKNVIDAINNYLATIPFDGKVVLSNLLVAIKSVTGVRDCVFINIQARADSTTVGMGTYLVQNKYENQKDWDTVAGYIIPENTAGANWRLTDYRVGSSGALNLNLISE